MITILRHQIPSFRDANLFEVSLHGGASVIHIGQIRVPARVAGKSEQAPSDQPDSALENGKAVFEYFLWAVEDNRVPIEKRRFWYVRDGDDMDELGEDAALFHIASFQSVNGFLWSHVFDITHLPDDFVPKKRIGPAEFRMRPSARRQGAGRRTA